jgi:hypothetical protein
MTRNKMQREIIQEHYKILFGENQSDIQWEVLQTAIKKYKPNTTVLKMIQNISPTRAHMSKLKPTGIRIVHAVLKSLKISITSLSVRKESIYRALVSYKNFITPTR